MFSKLRRTINCNKLDLQNTHGIQLKYSKLLAFNGTIIFAGLIALDIVILYEKFELQTILLFFVGLFIYTYFFIEYLSHLLFKNPILILDGNQLYYIDTNQWYNIMDFEFEDEVDDGGVNGIPKSYYCMFDKKTGKKIFSLRNWHLFDEENFKLVLHNRRYLPI